MTRKDTRIDPRDVTHLDYRPRILYPTRADDLREIQRLRAMQGTRVFDSLPRQLGDLLTTRHPNQDMSPVEVDHLVQQHLDRTRPERYGVWVYYPWSGFLVHLLDEAEFVELRTNRNRYKITPVEQHALNRWRVGIVGLSVGHSVALTMALERGCGELRLADFDLLDLSNLNRIRTGVHNLGLPKAYITAREIAEIDPFLKVVCFPYGVLEDTIGAFYQEGGDLNLVVDECDSLDIKLRLRSQARRLGIPVVMDTSDRGMIDIERFDLEPDRPSFHGLVEALEPEGLAGLTTEEKLPYVLKIIGTDTTSPRLRGSLLEVGQTVRTWPQLASGVTLGGAASADVSRRIALGHSVASGRYYIDLEELIGVASEKPAPVADTSPQENQLTPNPSELLEVSRACGEAPWRSKDSVELGRDQLAQIMEAAVAAPSGGNSQPWVWVYQASTLLLFLDRRRGTTQWDPQGNGGLVALGAAAENVVLAAHHHGLELRLQPFPLSQSPDLVAAFQFFDDYDTNCEPHLNDRLYQAVQVRHTNRRNGSRGALPPESVEALVTATRSTCEADIHLLTSANDLAEIGDLLASADRLRLLDRELHQELMAEIRWTGEEAQESRDGIFVDTLELSPLDRCGLEMCRDRRVLDLVQAWGGGAALETMARRSIDGASAVALITMPQARKVDYFNAGRAVQRAWLTAIESGIAVHPMTVLPYLLGHLAGDGCQSFSSMVVKSLQSLGRRYHRLFPLADDTCHAMLLRLSMADLPTCRSIRRPIDEVLIIL